MSGSWLFAQPTVGDAITEHSEAPELEKIRTYPPPPPPPPPPFVLLGPLPPLAPFKLPPCAPAPPLPQATRPFPPWARSWPVISTAGAATTIMPPAPPPVPPSWL